MALTRITQGVIKPNENYDTHNINSTGIVTATALNISGDASIGGVLTYEDVTNIDSIGIITARSEIKVGTGVTLTSAGAGFYAGIVTASNFVKRDGGEIGFSPDAQENLVAGTNAASNFSGTSAEFNTLIGYQAGKGITTGDRNVAIGRNAMASTDYGSGGLTGTDNVAIGNNVFSQRTGNASNNVFIGSGNIAYRCQSGNNNIGIGQYTYYYLTSGSNNIALGNQALDYSDTGNSNIAIGPSALTELTGGNNNNTAIGANVGTSLQNGSNNILIGYNAQASAQTVSNEITLGNSSIATFRIPGLSITIDSNGISDAKGNLRSIPQQNEQGSTHTLVAADAGKHILADNTVTVPPTSGIFSAGDAITIVNAGSSDISIAKGSGVTMYNAADGTDAGRTLAAKGMATILCGGSNTYYISGAGLS